MREIDRVRRLVERLSPEPACAQCAADRLELESVEGAESCLHELAGSDGFELRIGTCSLCGEARKVLGKGLQKAA